MKRIRRSGRAALRSSFAAAVAMAAVLGTAAMPAQAAEGGGSRVSGAVPLPPELEKIRAAEATKLYGSRPNAPWPSARPA